MADGSHIEWTDATWNPVVGCSVVSPGCTNCYAMRLAGTRLKHRASRAGLTRETKAGPVWTGEVRLYEPALDQPLRWRRPRRIFVCAHGDLFHEAVPDEWIDRVFAIMALAPQHTFQVLTKRARRMREYVTDMSYRAPSLPDAICEAINGLNDSGDPRLTVRSDKPRWPLPNVWLGVSVEDQARADERVPDLLATPAARRFVSCEPLLGPVDLTYMAVEELRPEHRVEPGCYNALTGEWWAAVGDPDFESRTAERELIKIDWVIGGFESGPGARGGLRQWARSLRDQCAAAGVPFFWKQNGEWIDADEWLDMWIASGLPLLWQSDLVTPFRPPRPLSLGEAAAAARGSPYEHRSDGTTLIRVGKSRAGRLLDGREHSEFPA